MSVRVRLTHWLHQQWQKKGWFSLVMCPLSALAALFVQRKQQRYEQDPAASYRSPVPVIVVGNIIVGGAGKTPVVLALTEQLRALGWTPGIVSRGYGVEIGPSPRVGQGQLAAEQFGDEPALIAAQTRAPIAVHPRRALAAQALLKKFPAVDLIISDDGLQHLALQRDMEVVVQDARGVGNGLLLPAGPLRESPERLRRVDWLISQIVADQTPPSTPQPAEPGRALSMSLRPYQLEHLSSGRRLSWSDWYQEYGQQELQALAAIGQPVRFFTMLRACGLHLSQTFPLPDHAALQAQDFQALHEGPVLITRKDAVKCQHLNDPRLWVVDVQPVFSRPDWIAELDSLLRERRSTSPTLPGVQ
ncbi:MULTISPECIES: tetraacyldisaccharide 4'-kinase [Alcaligenes]|jgi:tetraacyldisaccharide 4'-kinase|uniref:tetraacyldisaccharide 4'-kinase n=1 Tax=Alcaligenes TaxID=507 RepID=UPI001EF090B7|nr:tetraacyldisaccharide 4'-kinase [Alcaligenes faecalis]ULH08318.1 tetraacyldisaccharide 4'-kinase [Alcaligenes faecalis]